MVKSGSQNWRILRALADGRWHTVAAIHRRAGTSRLNSRISELRKVHGYAIEHEVLAGKVGALGHRYRLSEPLSRAESERLFGVGAPALPIVPGEVFAPRDQENRYRIYRLVYDELQLVATAPDEESVGVALVRLGKEQQFSGSAPGLLDSRGSEGEAGTWVISPWDTVP